MPIVSDDAPWGVVPREVAQVLAVTDLAELEAALRSNGAASVAWLGPVVPRATAMAAAAVAYERATRRFGTESTVSQVRQARARALVDGEPTFISYERFDFPVSAPGSPENALRLLRRPASAEGSWISLCTGDGPCADPIAASVFEERVLGAMTGPKSFVFYRAFPDRIRLERVEWVNAASGGVAEFRKEVERVRERFDSDGCQCSAPSDRSAAQRGPAVPPPDGSWGAWTVNLLARYETTRGWIRPSWTESFKLDWRRSRGSTAS